jgi:hypothetical protein
MFNTAVRKAGSSDPAAVINELKSLEYNGICTRYRADSTNVLNHAADIVKFDAGGALRVVKHLSLGELAVPGATTTTGGGGGGGATTTTARGTTTTATTAPPTTAAPATSAP